MQTLFIIFLQYLNNIVFIRYFDDTIVLLININLLTKQF